MLLEATRECCNDVFDLPALKRVMSDVRSRKIRVVPVETEQASPFARSLLFGWIAVYMYEGDAPLAERRAAALALDRELLRDLLGAEELRSLLDADVVAQVELELQRLTPERAARDADELHDLMRILGPLDEMELAARMSDESPAALSAWLRELTERHFAFEAGIAGDRRFAAAEDAGAAARRPRVWPCPWGCRRRSPSRSTAPLRDLVSRYRPDPRPVHHRPRRPPLRRCPAR